MTKRVLALVAAFAVNGVVTAKEAPKVEASAAEAKAGILDTVASYTTKPVANFVSANPWTAVATVAALTLVAEKAAMFAYDNLVAEQSDDLDVE